MSVKEVEIAADASAKNGKFKTEMFSSTDKCTTVLIQEKIK